ncbi:MAG TPA: hypothetical protein VHY19_01985 [Steroidobacteraceae bacterium]|jgi:hypothetical protein|nr:hypothetical protein [Steroidobacteraceae bacterium]
MDLRQAHFEYEPFPIGLVRNVFEPTLYERFVDSFPPVKIFRFMQLHGDKWSLSELNNSRQYHKFLHANTDWRYLYEQVKSPAFIAQVLDELARHKIALGLTAATRSNGPQRLLNKLLGRRSSGLKARFEFSMMSAAGGHILPHTDSPQKLITLVMSIVRPGEWNQTWGGGTDRMRPLDPSDNFNFLNRYLRFDQTETIGTIPYEPNQCAIFIKTFNSLHGVQPMRGPAAAMRRTLTVNIEAV